MDKNIFALRKISVSTNGEKDMLKFDLYGNDTVDKEDNECSLKSSFIIPVNVYPAMIKAFIGAGLQLKNNGVNIEFTNKAEKGEDEDE